MLHGLKKLCNMHNNEMEHDGHRHNSIYDHAYMFDDAHRNDDVIDGDDGDDDDDDDGDYDYAPAASMEGHGSYDSSLPIITNAADIWKDLKARFVGIDKVKEARLQTLESEFETLKMKDSESLDEFTGKISQLVSQASNLGSTIENKRYFHYE
ncbi:hypothetical protein Tco_0541200 [Tanacetum coccineum]